MQAVSDAETRYHSNKETTLAYIENTRSVMAAMQQASADEAKCRSEITATLLALRQVLQALAGVESASMSNNAKLMELARRETSRKTTVRCGKLFSAFATAKRRCFDDRIRLHATFTAWRDASARRTYVHSPDAASSQKVVVFPEAVPASTAALSSARAASVDICGDDQQQAREAVKAATQDEATLTDCISADEIAAALSLAVNTDPHSNTITTINSNNSTGSVYPIRSPPDANAGSLVKQRAAGFRRSPQTPGLRDIVCSGWVNVTVTELDCEHIARRFQPLVRVSGFDKFTVMRGELSETPRCAHHICCACRCFI